MAVIRLAVVNNELSPYRVHKLRRFAAEIPGLELRTFLMNSVGTSGWRVPVPPELNLVDLGQEGNLAECTTILQCALHAGPQYRKGQRLLKELAVFKPTALLCFSYSDVAHLMALDWAMRREIPCLLRGDSNIRCDNPTGLKRAIKRTILPMLVRRCSAVLPCGTLGRQYFRRYGAIPSRIFYVPYEPDYCAISRLPEVLVQEVRQTYGLRSDRRRLVYSGRLAPVKRVDLLLEAFNRIAERRPQWDLLVVGTGPLEAQLRGQVQTRFRDRVTWTGFVDTQDKVSALYRSADVLVLPSCYEPWALVVNEAACAGLALVCSDVVGAAAELLRDGENGRPFPSGDIDGLVRALLDVTEEGNLARYQARSPQVLADWRRRGDPVAGFRAALNRCGIAV